MCQLSLSLLFLSLLLPLSLPFAQARAHMHTRTLAHTFLPHLGHSFVPYMCLIFESRMPEKYLGAERFYIQLCGTRLRWTWEKELFSKGSKMVS